MQTNKNKSTLLDDNLDNDIALGDELDEGVAPLSKASDNNTKKASTTSKAEDVYKTEDEDDDDSPIITGVGKSQKAPTLLELSSIMTYQTVRNSKGVLAKAYYFPGQPDVKSWNREKCLQKGMEFYKKTGRKPE